MIEWMQQNSSAINALSTVILVFVTAWYVYLTKRILRVSETQSKLSLNPVLGLEIKEIEISEVFGPKRRQISVELKITNVGNAPAIEVLIDAEIELRYSSINHEKKIPARHAPDMIPYIKAGETNEKCQPNFGNVLVTHFFDDVRESNRLNLHRIETDPTKDSYNTSKIKIVAYYRNSLGQYFNSCYEAEIGIWAMNGKEPIPNDNEKAKISIKYVPRPIFHAGPILKIEMDSEISSRDSKRELCGW